MTWLMEGIFSGKVRYVGKSWARCWVGASWANRDKAQTEKCRDGDFFLLEHEAHLLISDQSDSRNGNS